MKIDLEFRTNQLLLNPRLPKETREIFEAAWRDLVNERYISHVGISTSGSSGDSFGRLILLSKEAIEASAQAVNDRFASGPGDIWFKSLPSFHVGGLGILVRAKLSGAGVYEDKSEKWSATEFISQVRKSHATLISLVPTQVFDLAQAQLGAPPSVRALIVGGGRLEEGLRIRALELGWPCLPSYGMTETCSQIATAISSSDSRLELLSHVDAKTLSDGRLAVKCSSLLSAQISFDSVGVPSLIDPKHDGWLTTEDHARVDSRIMVIEGRTADFVKVGGEGVVMARLEEKLENLKLVMKFLADAAIIAVPDQRLGARLVMMTDDPPVASASSPCEAADAQALMDRFNAEVAPFERIRELKQVLKIPRSPLGKLLRGQALALLTSPPLA